MNALRSPAGLDVAVRQRMGSLHRMAPRLWVAFGILLLVVYVFHAVTRAPSRLWYDELFTWYVSQQPSMSGVWAALMSGLDQHPPLYFWFTRAGVSLVGDVSLGLRLPSILGILLMSVCLLAFVSRRCGIGAGFVSLLFMWLTPAYAYAFEARPYGLVLGFAALALLCWQLAADGVRRAIVLPVLSLSMAAALLCHCYAVLLFAPLGIGEAVRTFLRRKLDWKIWVAILAASPAVLVYIPILQASRQLLTYRPWSEPMWIRTINFYKDVIDPTMIPLTATLFAIGIVALLFGRYIRVSGTDVAPSGSFTAPETAAILTLAAFPILGVLLGRMLTGVMELRYVFPFVLGYAMILGAAAGSRQLGPLLRPVLLVLLGAWFFAGSLGPSSRAQRVKTSYGEVPAELTSAVRSSTLPIVFLNPFLYLELTQYGDAQLRSRIAYVVDPETAVRYGDTDVFDRGLPLVKRWADSKPNIVPLQEFAKQHGTFLLYGQTDKPINIWLLPKLLDDGADVRVKWGSKNNFVWEVTQRSGSAAASGK